MPLVLLGSTLYAVLPGLEFAPLAAAETGANVEEAARAVLPWFVPIHVIGALAFGWGVLAFGKAICDSDILTTRIERLVAVALAVMAVARFVPISAVHFYVQGAAAIAGLWTLAPRIRAQVPNGAGMAPTSTRGGPRTSARR